MGDAAIEVGFPTPLGVMGSWSSRDQVAELSCQRLGESICYDRHGDAVIIRMF